MKLQATLLGLCLVTSTAWADAETAAQLRDRALRDETAWNVLESLTTEIGPRPAGSPALARARDWGVAELKGLGFANVHVEVFRQASLGSWI